MQSDVLVIGAGGAGLVSALSAYESGASVRVLTKEYPTRSQTCMAQGGINGVLSEENDSVSKHIEDTLKSAHNEADKKSVEILCSNAKQSIEWLDSIGVPFSRTKDGKIAQRKLGGASGVRACYAKDYTGLKILHTLYDKVLQTNIDVENEKFLLELLKDEDGRVCGAKVLDIRTSQEQNYYAKAVILATGGYSKIYSSNTTNSKNATGDGVATALRCGAKLSGMEFVQFHPTALKNSSILIGESARGEGGYLVNSDGKRFVDELAPRDVVARAIDNELKNGKDVFIDIRHLGEEFIEKELPQERKLSILYEGIDPTKELIPIKPSAHYSMGGVDVDSTCRTNLKGLFAVGECANQKVHGANRLGGNSLLEIVVFGRIAGKSAVEFAKDVELKEVQTSLHVESVLNYSNEVDFYKVKKELGELLYENVGIVRTKTSLQKAKEYLQNIDITKMGVIDKSKVYNTNLTDFLEFVNMVEVSKAVVDGALSRDESCGAHFMGVEDEN